MTDAEYLFRQTSKERKRNGIGDFHKKRGGGKVVRFPSDHLSRKEKKALNGEAKTYSFRDPLTWEKFRELPKDIRQFYLDTLTDKFHGVLLSMIAESMGVSRKTLSPYMNRHGLVFHNKADLVAPRSARKKFLASEDGKAWVKWHEDSKRYQQIEEKAAAVIDEAEEEEADVVENDALDNVSACEAVGSVDNDIEKIASLIASLKGTGAKITIEMVL